MTLVKFNNGNTRPNGFFFDNWADDFFRPFFPEKTPAFGTAAVNISEHAEGFQIELAAPGLAKEDFKISLENDVLKIAVAKETQSEENQPNYHRKEFSYTNFERAFKLPKTVNQEGIQAKYENGLLWVSLPKNQAALTKGAKEITIG